MEPGTRSRASASGSKVLARLTAEIEDSWHIYSSTTPCRNPVGHSRRRIRSGCWLAGVPARPGGRVQTPTSNRTSNGTPASPSSSLSWNCPRKPPAGSMSRSRSDTARATRASACPPSARARARSSTSFGAPWHRRTKCRTATSRPYVISEASPPPPRPPSQRSSRRRQRNSRSPEQGLFRFALVALGFGFVAVLTPCVFPMIPIYMGSFLGGGARPWRAVLAAGRNVLPRSHPALHGDRRGAQRIPRAVRPRPDRLQPVGQPLHRRRDVRVRR